MSWFARSFSMKEEDEEERRRRREDDGGDEEDVEEEEEEEEESDSLNLAQIASATGASVKEDLSNLGKTFTRQLWGVASFLAPPPPEQSSAAAERREVVEGESSREQGHDAVVGSSNGARASEIEFQGGKEEFSTLQNLGLAESSSSTSGVSSGDGGGTLSASGGSDPLVTVSPHGHAYSGDKMAFSRSDCRGFERPILTGLQSDFAELRGTVATGISRITSVLREVTRDDDSEEEEEDEEEEEHVPLVSSRESPHLPFSSPKGSEQGVNSPRSGFDAFLKPLFGNMLMQETSPSGEDEGTERGPDYAGESPGKGEPMYRELESLPSVLIASGIGGISKLASSLLQIVGDDDNDDKEDELDDEYLAEVGLTEPVVTFARNIAMHPETWLDFPLTEDDADDEFELTTAQEEHIRALEVAAPRLEALKIELCPNYMTEGRFWKIYFVLMHSRLSLNEALMLSNPQVVKARESMLQELKRREVQTEDLDPHQEDLTDVEKIKATQDSKEGQETFGGRISSQPADSSAISNPAGSSSFENTIKGEEVTKVDYSTSTSKEGTGLIESKPEKERSSMLQLQDETEVDEWPDEEPSTKLHEIGNQHSHLDTSNLDEEDVSFSDLEEDDSSDKTAYTNKAMSSSTSKSRGSLVLDGATTVPLVAKETTSPMTEGDGTPRKSSEKGEFNDWLKVDQDDVASAGSSSP